MICSIFNSILYVQRKIYSREWNHKILWDFEIQTYHRFLVGMPHPWFLRKEKQICQGGTVVCSCRLKNWKKMDKCLDYVDPVDFCIISWIFFSRRAKSQQKIREIYFEESDNLARNKIIWMETLLKIEYRWELLNKLSVTSVKINWLIILIE